MNQSTHNFPNENEPKFPKYDCHYDETITDDNYLTGRVLLKFNLQSSIVLKMPSPKDTSKMDPIMDTHRREIFMYENVLPRLFEWSNGDHFAPRCHAITETKGLVLEDLEAHGYRGCDCRKQLDLDHCRVALRALAKYHALSVKYIQNSSCVPVDTLAQMPYNDPAVMTFCYQLYDRFLKQSKSLVPKPAYRKLCHYKDRLEEKWSAVYRANEISTGFGVIAHGNFCTYNILFAYDQTGRVHRAKMINWQMSRIATPVFDLVYFFVGSVQFEVFRTHRDALFDLYVDTLNESLAALKCDCTYTRADLDGDLEKYQILFPIFSSCILQIMMSTNDSRTFTIQRNDALAPANYSSAVAKWLNYFVENGIV